MFKKMNKRGQNLLLKYIFDTIFVIAVIAVLLLFTIGITKKETFQKQIVTKQMILLIDSADSENSMALEHANLTISKIKNNIEAKTKLPFSYDFFSPYNIEFSSSNGKTTINIFEKQQ